MKQLFLYVRDVLRAIEDPSNQGKKLFKTVKHNNNQFENIMNTVENKELPYMFPAAFISFIGIRYKLTQNNVNEGSGLLRVRYILERLNSFEDEFETEIYDYADIVNAALMDAQEQSLGTENNFIDRFSLQNFDEPSAPNNLQACWLDYEIKFRDYSSDKTRDWVERTLITPSFTNWDDVEGDDRENVPFDFYEDQVKLRNNTQ